MPESTDALLNTLCSTKILIRPFQQRLSRFGTSISFAWISTQISSLTEWAAIISQASKAMPSTPS